MTNTVTARAVRACFCFAILLAFAASPFRADAAAPKEGNTRILSEKMTYDSAQNQVIFEGNVHVTRADLEIWSERLTLVLNASEKKSSSGTPLGVEGGGKVEKIIAEKNVRIKQQNKLGTSGRATYFVNDGKIVMEQNPMLVDGENRIRGRVINYFTASGRSEVIGNVDVQFTTDDKKGPALPGLPVPSGNPVKNDSPAGASSGEKAAP